jgi:hypothetical protein
MTMTQLAQQLASLDAGIALFDKAIIQASKNNNVCKRLQSIPGIVQWYRVLSSMRWVGGSITERA